MQCNFTDISMIFFTKKSKNNAKIYMEPQENPNSQNNIEQKEQSRRHKTS